MRARPERATELRSFVENADPGYLGEHLQELALALGLSADDVAELALVEPAELALRLRQRLQEARAAGRAARARVAEQRAANASLKLSQTARWVGDGVELDAWLLLGDLADHPTARLIGFDGPGWQVAVPKAKFRQARSALGRLPGLQALVDAQGLHLRWHDGRGGLDLRPVPVDPRGVEPALVVRLPAQEQQVALPGPASARARPPAAARPGRAGGAWLGHVLSDLGLLG